MSDTPDIVERLARLPFDANPNALCRSAADEIVSLRQRVADLHRQLEEAAECGQRHATRAEAAESQRDAALEALRRTSEFVKWAVREGPWQGGDIDGASIQEKAVELGLLVSVPYDPEKHGDPEEREEVKRGDPWLVFSDTLTALDGDHHD